MLRLSKVLICTFKGFRGYLVAHRNFKIPWNLEDCCPCGSNNSFGNCCFDKNFGFKARRPNLKPTGECTGYRNPRCYLGVSANCSKEISKEHYISHSLLKQFERLRVTGIPWDPNPIELPAKKLTSKILCQRHNNALSKLDAEAGRFFEAIDDAMKHASEKSLSRKAKNFLLNGDAFELWGVKTIAGLYHAKVSQAHGQILKGKYSISDSTISTSLMGRGLPQPLGLYIGQAGNAILPSLKFSPFISEKLALTSGLKVIMAGAEFDFLIDTNGANSSFLHNNRYYRPSMVEIIGARRNARIFLTWANDLGVIKKAVTLNLSKFKRPNPDFF